jgi:uncharacterized protein (TIGR03067 family)
MAAGVFAMSLSLLVVSSAAIGNPAPYLGTDSVVSRVPEVLLGAWVPVLIAEDGQFLPAAEVERKCITFDEKSCFFFTREDGIYPPRSGCFPATYSVNMQARPCTIDMEERGPTNGKPALLKGIFAADKNQVRLCIGRDDQARPTEFRSTKGGPTLYILKRFVPS